MQQPLLGTDAVSEGIAADACATYADNTYMYIHRWVFLGEQFPIRVRAKCIALGVSFGSGRAITLQRSLTTFWSYCTIGYVKLAV